MWQNQQLLDTLEDLLLARKRAISEYDIITLLQRPPYSIFDKEALREPLTLFRCHFILFHHLYLLQERWLRQGHGMLRINVSTIVLSPLENTSLSIEKLDPLKDYYLDWQNFDSNSENDVQEMLASFWRQMKVSFAQVNRKDKQAALTLLGLEANYDIAKLKFNYRKMLHKHHPDKGGDVEICKKIEWAYKILK
ncbi:DNA-J related domain-containing protein [Aliiglaciecola sp. 2_MG-2023]|uniref:DNA-J related domain-containing protein n=1 Tax=unclassified Aliiglaciecola TaxID=2593648 RepID=UPI0026E4841E|nr:MULTISPECIES: DNA-J related domain-containing protein [unclassified Aliiglaciecola]MDO6709433.1 DNA-J related domain-containing protein [Aliiglaciecola sp. 2_MG-2023]MDO6750581.1 DNA-J related domain-containing protein [Aliiglaciecola sp. 1_MG-2023]